MQFNKSLGMVLLAIWLIITGLAPFVSALAGLDTIMAILALFAGLLILINR